MNLSEIAIKRPVFTVMMAFALLVLGLVGFKRLGTDLFPDVTFPVVAITVPYPGASPSEVETLVTKPIEDNVVSLNGIDRLTSFSREGSAQILVIFKLDQNLDECATQVRERVQQIRARLPAEVKEPSVSRFDVSAAPILTYTLRGNLPLSKIRKIADDEIKPAIERMNGVAMVDIKGGAEREIRVNLHKTRLEALKIDANLVLARLRGANLNVPAGHYETKKEEISVRTLGEFKSVEDIRNVVISTTPDGAQVRLRDIASVEDGFEDMRTTIRANGESAVSFEVRKQSGENSVSVANAVKARMALLEKDLPAGVKPALIVDQSKYILENAHEVEIAIVFGGAMAILIILVFMLDLRSTLISAVALPTSVIGTFFAMYLLGYTLNMMTLLGLSLAIGLLIDDAVVVRENIFKHLEMGKEPRQAALDGTKEITLAVLATTATVVAVFLPVAFMDGMIGQFFRQFGITISCAVVISMGVAFTLDPMLSSRYSKKIDKHSEHVDSWKWLKRPFEASFEFMEHFYYNLLHWCLNHKFLVAVASVASLFLMGFTGKLMGSEFVNAEDRGQYIVEIEYPAGTSLDETSRRSLFAEKKLLQNKEVVTVFSTLGPDGVINRAKWRVVTTPKSKRTVSLESLKQVARDVAMEGVAKGTKVNIGDPPFVEGANTESPIMVNIRGENYKEIQEIAEKTAHILRTTAGIGDTQVKFSPGRPELQVQLDRQKVADYNLSVADVAMSLRTAVEGQEATKFRDGKDEIPVVVRLDEVDRRNPADLVQISINSPRGTIKLGDVAHFNLGEGPQVIERESRQRQIVVTATPIGRPLGDVLKEFKPRLDALQMPKGASITYGGQIRQMNDTNQNMGLALILGVVFIYIVLASQFESFIHPMTIMVTLPLALVGAFVGLFLMNMNIAMGALIGIILLMGLVTKNAILLMDRALVRVRDHGETPMQAILEAGPERLRPILMTSAAMILGMLPTALNQGEGSEFRAPMAVAVIGGVVSSTLLSLVVVPVFYLAIENAKNHLIRAGRWIRSLFGGDSGKHQPAE
jgi:hydrophobic/amphiphilic exporter-1 (mainly G- bacteria), HAE1 family